MFQLLFKYPSAVFRRGQFVLLGSWPAWLLVLVVGAAVVGVALLIRWRLQNAAPEVRNWRAWAIWGMQSGFLAAVLFLLWQPAIIVAELSPQQNIIAVVVDDSRSMSIADGDGRTREALAVAALEGGVLAGLEQRFQTRVYRLGGELTRVQGPEEIAPVEPSTRIGENLKRLATETSDLPVGAIVLLSDGGQNSAGGGSGISRDVLQALRNRRLPVHTVGFGKQESAEDVEIEDVSIAASAIAESRISATVSLTQRGYAGKKAKLTVRDGAKQIAEREITLAPDGRIQAEPVFFPAGAAGAKSLTFSIETLSREENLANNTMTRP